MRVDFSESQSIAIGSDRNRKPFDLQLTFTEPLGGICMAILQFWLEYIASVTIGEMVAYPFQIDRQILNYTVSIYRFILDPSKQYIQNGLKVQVVFLRQDLVVPVLICQEMKILLKLPKHFQPPLSVISMKKTILLF